MYPGQPKPNRAFLEADVTDDNLDGQENITSPLGNSGSNMSEPEQDTTIPPKAENSEPKNDLDQIDDKLKAILDLLKEKSPNEAALAAIDNLRTKFDDLNKTLHQKPEVSKETKTDTAKAEAKITEATGSYVVNIIMTEGHVVQVNGDNNSGNINIGATEKSNPAPTEDRELLMLNILKELLAGQKELREQTKKKDVENDQQLKDKITAAADSAEEVTDTVGEDLSKKLTKKSERKRKKKQETPAEVDEDEDSAEEDETKKKKKKKEGEETTSETETETDDKVKKDAAEQLLGKPLDPETNKDLNEAAKPAGFAEVIKRTFSGTGWKRWVTTVVGTVASIGLPKLAGLALATGPIGASILGGAILGMGIYTGVKVAKNLKETADKEGKKWWELFKDKDMLLGMLAGGAVSGISRGIAHFVPGIGPLLGMGVESAIAVSSEKYLNKKQSELLTRMMDEYGLRRYNNLKDKGYVVRGVDGTPKVSTEGILTDMDSKTITENERKTARKTGIAVLMALHEQGKDPQYKTIKYTDKDGKPQEIDVTKLALKTGSGNTDAYPTLELNTSDGETVNVEAILDKLDTKDLSDKVRKGMAENAAKGTTQGQDFAKKVIQLFVGLEAGDVDTILSEERKYYLQTVHFTTGLHTTMGAVSAITSVFSGGNILIKEATAMSQPSNYAQGSQPSTHGTDTVRTEANGHKYIDTDMDGDGKPDVTIDADTKQVTILNDAGAAKMYELQHPGVSVESHTLADSTTGISRVLTDSHGQVVGVVFDQNGASGIMTTSELAGHLHTTTGESMTITSIASNGDAVVAIGGATHNINLGHLDSINVPGTTHIETQIGHMTVPTEGDSMNSMLHRVMQEARTLNPNLPNDDVALERMMYQKEGGAIANDYKISKELGFMSQDATARNPISAGDPFNWSESPTIMNWLKELNGGAEINLGASQVGTSGSNIGLSFTPGELAVSNVEIPSGITAIQGGSVFGAVMGALGGIAAGVFASGKGSSQVGGINRANEYEDGKVEASAKGPEATSGVKRTTETTSEEEKKKLAREILVNQVFTNIRDTHKVIINKQTYEYDKTKSVWKLGNKEFNKEQLVDLLLAETPENAQKDLASILTPGVKVDTKITLQEGSYTKKMKKETVKTNYFWENDKDENVINPSDLAKLILDQKATSDKTTTELGEAKAEAEKEKIEFEPIAKSILSQARKIWVNDVSFTKDIGTGVWKRDSGIGNLGATGPEFYQDEQIAKIWKEANPQNLKRDLEKVFREISPKGTSGKSVIVPISDQQYEKVSIVKQPATATWQYKDDPNDASNTATTQITYVFKKDANAWFPATPEDMQNAERIKARKKISAEMAEKLNKPVKQTTEVSGGVFWKSDKYALNDKQFAEFVGGLQASAQSESKQAEGTVENKKDGETKTEKKESTTKTEGEKSNEKEKPSFARKLVKTALVVAAVAGGIAATAAGVALPVAGLSLLAAGTTAVTQIIAEKSANRLNEQMLSIRESNKTLTKEQQEELEKKTKKRDFAKRLAKGARDVFIATGIFGGSMTLLSLFGPTIQSFSIQIKAQIEGITKGFQILQTVNPFSTAGDTVLRYGAGGLGSSTSIRP